MLEDCVPWEDTQRHIRGSAERRGLPGGAVLGVVTKQVILVNRSGFRNLSL